MLFRRFGHEILKCETCSLVYINQLPLKQEVDRLYSEGFFQSSKFSDRESSSSFLNSMRRVDWALRLPEIGKDAWLDLGCATGDFLLAAQPHVKSLHGSDISPFAIEQASQRGLTNLRAGDFIRLDYPEGAFDFISMWDLLEHLADPTAALEKVFRLLKPAGYLAISTGDVDSLASRLIGRYWHLMIPPLHTYFFSKRTIQKYLERSGFQEIQIDHPGKRVPLDFAVEKLIRLASPALSQKWATQIYKSSLSRINVPINLFDIMTISARKPKERLE